MSDDLSHAVNPGRIFFFREPKKGKGKKGGKGKKASKREGAKRRHDQRARKFALHAHGAGHAKCHEGEVFLARTRPKFTLQQQWLLRPDGRIVLNAHNDRCLTVEGGVAAGTKVGLEPIDTTLDAMQVWTFGVVEHNDESPREIVLKSETSLGVGLNSKNPDKPKPHDFLVLQPAGTGTFKFMFEAVPLAEDNDVAHHHGFAAAQAAVAPEEKFEDVEFVCSPESVGDLLDNQVEWKRAADFLGADLKVFDVIAPDDILQGALGDCYLLCGLSALAEHPERIKKILSTHEVNAAGLYGCKLYLDGVETEVVVDDFFPVFAGTNVPAFTRNKGKELWALLLEKVYAKVHSSYEAIEGGAPGDALSDLTGAPYTTYRSKYEDAAQLHAIMVDAEHKHFLMAASVSHWDDHDLKATIGLVEGHAYTVLDARTTSTGAQVVKIRNPWGSLEWKGDWSDGWSGWTDELKAELQWVDANDGTYWMSIDDFRTFFSTLTVVFVHDDWNLYSHQTILSNKTTVFDLVVQHTTSLRVTAHQRRGTPTLHTRLCVRRPAGGDPVQGTSEVFSAAEANSTGEMTLEPGTYNIVVDLYESDLTKLPQQITVSAYASQPVSLARSAAVVDFVLPEWVEKYGRCFACDLVLSGTSISAMGQKWHPHNCFVCCTCQGELEGSFFVSAKGLPECAPCVEGARDKCGKCNNPVSGAYIKALGKTWEPDCFRCFGPGNERLNGPFYVVSGNPVCTECINKI